MMDKFMEFMGGILFTLGVVCGIAITSIIVKLAWLTVINPACVGL